MSKILGIDPGSRICGYGVVEQQGRQSIYVTSGIIRLSQTDFSARLGELFESLQQILQLHQPEQAAIEKVFVGKSADSALKLGQARGVALLALHQYGLEIAEYSPRTIKQAVTGSGAADKTQICDMVVRSLGLNGKPTADAADALAIALCHAYSANFQHVLRGRSSVAPV